MPFEIGSFQGEVRFLGVAGDWVYACVESPTGARLEYLSAAQPASSVLANLGPHCSGLVVNEEEAALYVGSWSGEYSVEGATASGIARMALPSGSLVSLTQRASLGTFDARGGNLAAGDYDSKTIVRAVPGGLLETAHLMANPPWEGEVRLDEVDRLLVSDRLDGSVTRYAADGTPQALFNGEASVPPSPDLHGFAVSGESVVVAFRDRVVAIDAATRAPAVLATGLVPPVLVVASDEVVLAISQTAGSVYRLDVARNAEAIVSGRDRITAAIIAGRFLYFSEASGAVSRVPFE